MVSEHPSPHPPHALSIDRDGHGSPLGTSPNSSSSTGGVTMQKTVSISRGGSSDLGSSRVLKVTFSSKEKQEGDAVLGSSPGERGLAALGEGLQEERWTRHVKNV